MKKSKALACKAVFLLMSIMLFTPFPVHAAAKEKVTNEGSVGAVDIRLDYEMEEVSNILPGQPVALDSSVTNVAEPAWVRVKIQYPVYANETVLEHLAENNLTELDDKLVTFASADWEKIGPYYYLKRPVKNGETVAFTKSIKFPSDWDNRMIQSKFGVCITAEAVQEKNFKPDFGSGDPWFGVVVESYDTTDYMLKGEGTDRFSIHYVDGAENVVRTGENFFSNWDTIMPGDTVTGKAEIKNRMSRPIRLFFGIESKKAEGVDESLLKQIHLTVRHGEGVIYNGDLAGSMEESMIHALESGEGDTLSYTLAVPSSMGNEYAEKLFQTVWTFRAEVVPEPPAPETPVEIIREIVKTGDTASMLRACVIGALLMAAAGIGMHISKGRRGNGEN